MQFDFIAWPALGFKSKISGLNHLINALVSLALQQLCCILCIVLCGVDGLLKLMLDLKQQLINALMVILLNKLYIALYKQCISHTSLNIILLYPLDFLANNHTHTVLLY